MILFLWRIPFIKLRWQTSDLATEMLINIIILFYILKSAFIMLKMYKIIKLS